MATPLKQSGKRIVAVAADETANVVVINEGAAALLENVLVAQHDAKLAYY